MISIELENSFRKALREGINLFLGAGFSILATDQNKRPLPLGAALKTELVEEFNKPELTGLDLSQLCTVLESTRKKELRSFLEKRYSVKHYDPRYKVLEKFELRTIYTTNIDDLIHNLFASSKRYYVNDLTKRGPVFSDRTSVGFVPLHGSIVSQEDPLVFSTTDVATSFSSDPDKWHFLTEGLQRFPTLFWGYGMADTGGLMSISSRTINEREQQPRWIVLYQPTDAVKQYFAALGFSIITAETAELLEYLNTVDVDRDRDVTSSDPSISKLFPEALIPAVGKVPVRPLLDFYLGGVPTWYDIFNNRIFKTSYYRRLIDLIYSGKSTIVIGIPACGKTTLMMQVANDIDFKGEKLILDLVSLEKANLLKNTLSAKRAIIFIDNCCDDADALSLLLACPNILIVGFEREINFDNVAHRFDRRLYNILDITELSETDIQGIFSRIPAEIRVPTYKSPKTQKEVVPSLYEVIETNITRPALSSRFKTLLQDLESEQPLHDLLVMMAYVHSCRTPVSIDMAHAFLRDHIKHFQDVYEAIDRLGLLISEYYGPLADAREDYFVPRSTIVAEAILDQVSTEGFKRVLTKFHATNSSYRICRFDIFKRSGFDERHATRAFPKWQEGRDFYEAAYQRDPSPYLRQQGALYLLHKKRYSEAFAWIDEALVKSRYKNPTIQNSHAIILFKANIDKVSTGHEDVRMTLDQSMEILSECYTYDRRKTYHALTFADQSLRYWEVYGDDTAYGYLLTARRWLLDEQKLAPWNRNVKRLYREVERVIQRNPPT